jgi:hypothetical protein
MLPFTVICSASGAPSRGANAGNLLTVSKRLHIRAPASTLITTRTLLHQEPSAANSQNSSDSGRQPSCTTISTRASSNSSHHETSQLTTTSLRHPLSVDGAAARLDVEHIAPQRYLTQGNQLVGGVFLHLTRKMSVISCSHLFSQKLSHKCYYDTDAGTSTSGAPTWTVCCAWYSSSDAELQAEPKQRSITGSESWCMQVASNLMEWIHRSIRTAVCTEQIPFSADGSSSTPLQTLQSCPPLELPLHFSLVALVALMTGFPFFSPCVSSDFFSMCQSSHACMCARQRHLPHRTFCSGASISCSSEKDAPGSEGCSVPGRSQSCAPSTLHHVQPPTRNVLHN